MGPTSGRAALLTRAPARVLHVVPADQPRGVQIFARLLRDRLDGRPDRHRTLTLFASDASVLRPDTSLDRPAGRSRRAGADPGAILALRRWRRSDRPDVVVAHGGEALKYAALGGGPGRLVYYKVGLLGPSVRRRPAARALYRYLTGRAAAVAAVSESSAREAEELLAVPRDRIWIVANGRAVEDFAVPRHRADRAPVVTFIGELEDRKQPADFVAVIRDLRHRGRPLQARMVGDGPLRPVLEEAADQAGVELLGRRGDIPALLADTDVLVLTSKEEGMPGVLIEAGLAAVPVVATSLAGASEVVEDGTTGLLRPVGDVSGLADAIEMLLADPGLRCRMGERARARCVQRFGVDQAVETFQGLLDTVLGRAEALAPPQARGS